MGRSKARPASGHRVQKSGYKAKLHQESERARPPERLRQEGKKRSAQGQTRAEQSAVKAEKAKLRMGKAQEKLAAQAPPKPPGSVHRAAGAAGWSLHGFVHGKIYEVEHENVGTEGAHHSELVGEAVGRKTARTVRQAIRAHPARAAARAERRYVKATAEHRFQVEMEKHPDHVPDASVLSADSEAESGRHAKVQEAKKVQQGRGRSDCMNVRKMTALLAALILALCSVPASAAGMKDELVFTGEDDFRFLAFEDLRDQVLEGNLTALQLEESIASIDAINLTEMYQELARQAGIVVLLMLIPLLKGIHD